MCAALHSSETIIFSRVPSSLKNHSKKYCTWYIYHKIRTLSRYIPSIETSKLCCTQVTKYKSWNGEEEKSYDVSLYFLHLTGAPPREKKICIKKKQKLCLAERSAHVRGEKIVLEENAQKIEYPIFIHIFTHNSHPYISTHMQFFYVESFKPEHHYFVKKICIR